MRPNLQEGSGDGWRDYTDLKRMLRALGDSVRLNIVHALASADEPTWQQRHRLAIAPQDQVMKSKAPFGMVAEKAQIVKQGPIGRAREKCLPNLLVAIKRRNGDRLHPPHVHLATVRQCVLTSPTVAVGNLRALTVASRSISRERAPFPICLAANSRTGS